MFVVENTGKTVSSYVHEGGYMSHDGDKNAIDPVP